VVTIWCPEGGGQQSQFVFSCYYHETANFSSDLDHRGLDISRALQGVFKEVDLGYTLTFVQMYAHTPHKRLSKVSVHPVSGCLVSCGSHPRHLKTMWSRADTYLTYMADLCLKFGPTVKARIKQVALFEEDIIHAIDSELTFDEQELLNLIENKPLLVPFTDVEAIFEVQKVAKHMVGKLK